MSDGIVIGEGVVLDARPAAFATRMLASVLDLVAPVALLVVLSWAATGSIDLGGENIAPALLISILVVVTIVLPTTVETLTRGRSLGKLAAGIRIVRDDGGPVRLRHAFIRALVGLGEMWLTLGSVALIVSLSNTKGRRVGDMLAGTYAIRVRGGKPTLVPLTMPPHLAHWAATADMRRLPDGLALACRQFLGRAQRLHAASRERVGRELAATVGGFVAPLPPLGTDPESFLMAVLAERSVRERRSGERARALAAEQAEVVRRLPYGVPDPVS